MVTVHTEKKIKRKTKCRTDGSSVDVSITKEPEDKMYRIPFHKGRRLNGNNSVPFGYIKERVRPAVISGVRQTGEYV